MGNGDLSSSATSKFRSNTISVNNKVWTNERHVDYLNSMEDTFVRSMLNSSPLNRHVPDIADSTLDHRSAPRARRHSTSDILESSIVISDKRTRRLPYRPYNTPTTQDQVVPQYEGTRANEEKDHQLHAAPAN